MAIMSRGCAPDAGCVDCVASSMTGIVGVGADRIMMRSVGVIDGVTNVAEAFICVAMLLSVTVCGGGLGVWVAVGACVGEAGLGVYVPLCGGTRNTLPISR